MTTALIAMAFVAGLGAGMCLDVATVKLPTRHRIGPLAYANFARGNDLGNGLKVYPYAIVGGALLLLALTTTAHLTGQSAGVLRPLDVAAMAAVGVLATTAKAGPIMWSLRTTPDDERLLAAKLDRFAYWHSWRTGCQLAAFAALLWALA